MARLARSVFPGHPHHVLQRAVGGQPAFESPADYRRYLAWLGDYAAAYGIEVWAYCLLPDHVHVVCVPSTGPALSRAFNTLHMRYAQHFNDRRSTSGHLWRPRYMSCALDAATAREEVRFVETNPVRKGLVARAEDYEWSSARSRVLGETNPVLSGRCPLTAEIGDWRAFLEGRGEEALIRRVRERLRTGRPAGSPEYVRGLEALSGRRLEARPRGRPRKNPE